VPAVIVGREEPVEHAVKRFTEPPRPSRFAAEPRNREHHENPSVKPTRWTLAARKKVQKRERTSD
jgi:ribosomal protein S21